MADTVVHFGADTCNRVLILRSAGYLVDGCLSLTEFGRLLQERADARAILLAESSRRERQHAWTLARSCSVAPLILFDDLNTGEGEKEFDLVIPPLTRPEEWLDKIAATIRLSQTLARDSTAIREHSELLRKQSELLRQCSVSERKRSLKARARIEEIIHDIQGSDSSKKS